jgi:2-keto-4-pentenoate hydratase
VTSGADLDERIVRGTERMLKAQRDAVADGAGRLGWKAGFGAPAAMASLGIDRPLVGFLVDGRRLGSGAEVETAGWNRAVLEAEVAAHLGSHIDAGAGPGEALAAVAGWSVAIELADVDRSPDEVEEIVAGNIFHRHVLLGHRATERSPVPVFSVLHDGVEVAGTTTPEELTGELGGVLASMAETLARCGDGLRSGDVVITGSVVPPVPLAAGTWRVLASGLGALEVTIR